MPESSNLASQVRIKIAGNPVPNEVLVNLVETTVDQHTHLPHMFTIRLYDPELKLLDEGPFDLTKLVEISAETGDGKEISLIKGEITALEPAFGEGMNAELVVRGFDKAHRLYREMRSRTYLNVKDSDLVSQIAQNAGLKTEVETTQTVYDHIYQHNQSDLDFLMQRAWRIGYECFVDDEKLYFRKPPTGGDSVTLTWGQELLSFSPRMTLAEQVDEVIVKGWDVAKKSAITGKAQRGRLYPKVDESKDGATWAQSFGTGKLIIVDQPILSQEEANTLATARLDEISGAFIEAEGVAFRAPDIRAGKMVKLEGLGKRFGGSYLVTSATHTYTATGLTTTFAVRGTRTGLLAEQMMQQRPLDRWIGVVPAIVTNTDDPKDWGRVKVKYPWMSDEEESDWARVAGQGAGPEAGLCIIPEVDDEVLVSFVHGDFGQPVVLGGLWNGQHPLPGEVSNAGSGEKPLVQSWHSRTGHWIALYDNADNKIEIVSAGGQKIVIDDANKKIVVEGTGDIEVKGTGTVKIEGSGDVKIVAGGSLSLEASREVKVKGQTINLN